MKATDKNAKIRFYTFECKCGHQQEFKVLRHLYGYEFAGTCDVCGRKMNHKNSKLVAI